MRDAPELLERARELTGRSLRQTRLITDTTNFMNLELGDVLEVEGRRFVLKGTEYEGRFGLDEQPKYWVKRAVDWED
ncbi:MAG: serine/threonine protein kinase, partial [Pseudomonadota bacterium]